MKENMTIELHGHIKIFHKNDPSVVLFDDHNTIVVGVKSLFSRLMADSLEPAYGIWGLAIGSGNSAWGDNPGAATGTEWQLENETKRKRRLVTRFLDTNMNPVVGFTDTVEVQTLYNATDDGITTPIREMGLIGGGSTSGATNMLTAPYWDPSTKLANSVTLINYKKLPTFNMPSGIDLVFSWIIQF
jgi:hypothetical protein